MIRIFLFVLLFCTIHPHSYAQNKDIDAQAAAIPEINCTSVDALVSYIRENFATDMDKVRAIYIWITHHINYDMPQFLAGEKNAGKPLQTVINVLETRNAVCHGYAELFIALCKGVGVNAIVIPGYIKKQGKVSSMPHAWVAASLGNEWYLFDPTWGAGYVKDNQFFRKFNNTFYKVLPANFIADHMPFDPMFQFLSNPLSPMEFIEGTPAANKAVFYYIDTLKHYSQLSSVQQNAAELRRLEAAGVQGDLLNERRLFLKRRLESFASKNAFEEGLKIFNGVIAMHREYISHKNKQFSTIGDNDLRQIIDSMEQNVKLSRSLITETKTQTEKQGETKTNAINYIDRFWVQLLKEKQFTEQYFATNKEMRKQLFKK